jgi:hypothetical protein
VLIDEAQSIHSQRIDKQAAPQWFVAQTGINPPDQSVIAF